MTKTQAKRAYLAILQKSQKLFGITGTENGWRWGMSSGDYVAIEKIVRKYLKKF